MENRSATVYFGFGVGEWWNIHNKCLWLYLWEVPTSVSWAMKLEHLGIFLCHNPLHLTSKQDIWKRTQIMTINKHNIDFKQVNKHQQKTSNTTAIQWWCVHQLCENTVLSEIQPALLRILVTIVHVQTYENPNQWIYDCVFTCTGIQVTHYHDFRFYRELLKT